MKTLLLPLALCFCGINLAQTTCTFDQKIVAQDRGGSDYFSSSTAISDGFSIFGAPYEDHQGNSPGSTSSDPDYISSSGSAYIFQFDGVNWVQDQKIVASDRGASDNYGFASDIDGANEYAIVGAYQEDHDVTGATFVDRAGSAYIYEKVAGTWVQAEKITAPTRNFMDFFGSTVAIDGNYAVVGAYNEDEDANEANTLTNSGSVYVFERTGPQNWTVMQKLNASDRQAGDLFGKSVDIQGNQIVIGANNEDHNVAGGAYINQAGSIYVFELNGGSWDEVQKLVASDRSDIDTFGDNVAIDGDVIVSGTYNEDHNAAGGSFMDRSGSAYVFEKSGGVWSQTAKLVASDRNTSDWFGYTVAVSGNLILVGCQYQDYDAAGGALMSSAGAAYSFEKDGGGNWVEICKIVPPDREANDLFGARVGISDTVAIIGSHLDDHNNVGTSGYSSGAGSAYYYIIDTPILLPVELAGYSANCENDDVVIDWSTASELNNDYFTIERSSDGTSFTELAQIEGAGTSQNSIRYKWTDTDPVNQTAYYRLSQTDFDGKQEVFDVKAAGCINNKELLVYPSPFTDQISLLAPESGTMEIRDVSGQLVLQTRFNSQENSFNCQHLAKGTYMLILTLDNGEQTLTRIVKM